MDTRASSNHGRAFQNVRIAHTFSSHDCSVCISIDGVQCVKEPGMCALRTIATGVRRRDRDQVAALANGMRAIEAFAASRQRMTLAEVAKHSGLTRAAARRYLLTLVTNGYADFDGKRFQLTSRVLRLGHAYISSVPLPQIAQPIVEELG